METQMIVNYEDEARFMKLRSTANPYTDEWNIYRDGAPVTSIDMPKGWQPSKRVRVNGVLGV